MSVLIVDYGLCNLGSVKRAFEECGAKVFVSSDPNDAKDVSHIVLPGVGAFGDAMKNLQNSGWATVLKANVQQLNIPLLGICLGMQLLAEKGYEGGEFTGLGLIPGEVKKLQNKEVVENFRVPHVGWNEIEIKKNHQIFDDLKPNTDFYFVHSYFFKTTHPENTFATTKYGSEFPSIVGNANTIGVQFHPEKSSRAGFQIIKNFLTIS